MVHGDALHDRLPALAHHWAIAAASSPPAAARAVEYASRAGDRALAQHAYDEAASYYRQALERSGPAEDAPRLDLLIALGTAQCRAGDGAQRETLSDAVRLARERGDGAALARAALASSRGLFTGAERVDADRVHVLESALEGLSADESLLRARLLADLADELTWSPDHERRHWAFFEALALARRSGDVAALGHVLARSFTSLGGHASETRAHVAELAGVAARLDDPALTFWSALWQSALAGVLADRRGYDEHLASVARLAGEWGQPMMRWAAAFELSCQARVDGRLDEAEAWATGSLEIGRAAGFVDAVPMAGASLFWVRFDQGRLGELVDRFAAGATRDLSRPLLLGHFALALCDLDRLAEAQEVFDDRLAEDGFSTSSYTRDFGLLVTAEVCSALADTERAGILTDLLAPDQGLVAVTGGPGTIGAVDHGLGLLARTLGRHDEAEAHFADATRVHLSFGAPIWLARTRLEWAQLLVRRRRPGDAPRARRLLAQALATAEDLHLGTIRRRAAALIGEAA